MVILVAALVGCRGPGAADRPFPIGPEDETAIGLAAALRVEERLGGRMANPAVQAYVRTVGERLAQSVPARPSPFHFTVLASGGVRLFSRPGGTVYVTRGLLEKLGSEGELAGLLAHQLAHIGARHSEDSALALLGGGVLREAAVAAGAMTAGEPVSRADARSFEKVIALWMDKPYTPEMEIQADRLGLDYMVAAGYQPGEMVRLMNVMASMEGQGAAEFLGLHPNPPDRASDIADIVGRKYPDRQGRVGRQEYEREVLERLRAEPQGDG
jgi:predicted Zn-dependent protease